MAQLPSAFSARAVQPASIGGGNNLPVGTYPVVITESELTSTKDGGSGMLVLNLEAIDGEFRGSKGKYRLNLFNANAQAAQIAQRQLSSVCHVTGVFDITDSAQLHGKPFVVVVELDAKNQADYPGSTRVVGVLDMAGNDPGKGGGAHAPAPAPAAPFAAPPAAAAPPAFAAAAPPAFAAAAAPAFAAAAAPAAPAWGAGANTAPAAAAPAWAPAAGAVPAGTAPPWGQK